MKRRAIVVAIMFTFGGCQSQEMPTSLEFNRASREYFRDHTYLLDSLNVNQFGRCILEKTIENDLDDLNGSIIVIAQDRFLIKAYFEDYLQMHFSFIKDIKTEKFYFWAIPELSEFLYHVDSNYVLKKDTYKLKRPRAPVKIPTANLNNVLSSDCFRIGDHDPAERVTRFRRASEVLTEAFPLLRSNETSTVGFIGKIHDDFARGLISDSAFNQTMTIVNTGMKTERYMNVYRFDKIGYLLTIFDGHSTGITIEMFFLPDNERIYISRLMTIKYRECFENSMVEQ